MQTYLIVYTFNHSVACQTAWHSMIHEPNIRSTHMVKTFHCNGMFSKVVKVNGMFSKEVKSLRWGSSLKWKPQGLERRPYPRGKIFMWRPYCKDSDKWWRPHCCPGVGISTWKLNHTLAPFTLWIRFQNYRHLQQSEITKLPPFTMWIHFQNYRHLQ